MMKLTVLGGSAAGVGTGQGCSSYLLQSETSTVVLDMGPNTLQELRKHTDFRHLDGIVISHLHVDHILDLVALRFTLSYNPVRAPHRLRLCLPPNGIDTLANIAKAFEGPDVDPDWFTSVFEIEQYDPDSMISINDLNFRFLPTRHFVPCWAIRVDSATTGCSMLYTADTGPSTDFTGFGKGVQLLLAESTGEKADPPPIDQRGHMSPHDTGRLATSLDVRTLVMTHMWEEKDPAQSVRAASQVFNGTILRAIPGLEVSWTT